MRIPLRTARAWAVNLWRARVRGETFLEPLGVTWHATHACNFRCTYCDDGRGNRYPDLSSYTMTTDEVKCVLSLARASVSMLYITGGEPLMRKDLTEIVRWAKQDARFHYIGLATNGVLLHRQEALLRYVDELEISLDSLNRAYYDQLLNAGPGTADAILDAVVTYATRATSDGYRFNVTSVVIAGHVNDARDVARFCFERGISVSFLPQSKGVYPDPALRMDPEYPVFIDDIVAAKREGAPVYGSYTYYSHIRDFRRFTCYPTLVPRIQPNGDLNYPCAPIGTTAGGLVHARSFAATLEAGRAAHGPVPSCDARCFATCYIETSSSMGMPITMIREHVELGLRLDRIARPLRALAGGGWAATRRRVPPGRFPLEHRPALPTASPLVWHGRPPRDR